MDETRLHELLDRASASEPPIGHLVRNSLRAGIRLRRRRRTQRAFSAAAAVVAIGVAPSVTAHQHTGPAAASHGLTAYVALESLPGPVTVLPVTVATNRPGRPIAMPSTAVWNQPLEITANGRTIYQSNGARKLTPIDTATSTAGPPILVPAKFVSFTAITPNGRTAYLVEHGRGVLPVNLVTRTAGSLLDLPDAAEITITPNGRTAYVVEPQRHEVVPVVTATNTPLRPITFKGPWAPTTVAITPDSKTAYVFSPSNNAAEWGEVTPIRTATNTALKPIKVRGLSNGQILVSPDGGTLYVSGSPRNNQVTPISTATNRRLAPITIKAGVNRMALSPDGRILYTLGWPDLTLTSVDTATGAVLRQVDVAKQSAAESNYASFFAVSPDGSTIYVGIDDFSNGHGTYSVIPVETATGTVAKAIHVSLFPESIVFAP
jgi:DNA-binding beta-propeller fold protein YncE